MVNKLFSLFAKGDDEQDLKPVVLDDALYNFMEQLPQKVLLVNEKGEIIYSNHKAARLLGYTTDELKTVTIDTLGLPVEEVHALLEKKSGQKIIKELVTKDINAITVSLGVSVLSGTHYAMLTIEDLSEYQQMVAEKSFFKTIFNNYPFAVTVQDRDGVCVLWNYKAEEIFSKPEPEALGKPIKEVFPEELVLSLEVLDKEVFDRGQSRVGRHMSFKNTHGQEMTLAVTKVPTLSSDGTVQSILSIFEDITVRKTQEQELVQTRNLMQAIIDHVPLGLYTRTADGVMTFFNKQSQLVFNESEPKCANSPHPKQAKETVYKYALREKAILKEGKLKDFPDEIYVDRTGNEKIIHMIKVPLKHAGPEPLVLSIVEDVTQKREQEREIFAANSFLSAIVDNAPIGLYARNREGKMLLRNKMCETIFGVMRNGFDDRGALPHESDEQVQGYMSRESAILESGKLVDIAEEEYINASGEKRIVHLIKVPVPDSEGNPGFVITLAEDITEKKEQESKLVEATNFQQAILDNAPIAIYARGLDSSIYFINKKAKELFPDENEYISHDDYYSHREESIFGDRKILEIPEEWYTSMQGKKMLLHLIKAPVFDKDGKPFMVLTIAEDITEKRMQEREIVDAKNFLQTVINNLPSALSVKKFNGEYILWNKKSEEVFGVLAKDVIGKTHYRTDITKEQQEFLASADKKVFESNKEFNIPQELISTPSEGVKIMHTVKTPVFNEDGTPNYLLSVSEDITMKTKMEKQIREASEKNSLLVENAREGIMILEDGKIIYANRAATRILGYDSSEEVMRKPMLDFVADDHKIFAEDKYEAVLQETQGASEPIDIHFMKKNGVEAETEFTAMASKYLGRRIIICFIRDVTSANKVMRDVKTEREKYKAAFEKNILPAFILNYKGYINAMNKACRDLFNFTEDDKNFYRNVYMRPALSLAVRNEMKKGNFAQMEYEFDFESAQKTFPSRVRGEGKMSLTVSFVPITKRDAKDGTVEADYLVFLQKKGEEAVLYQALLSDEQSIPSPVKPQPPRIPAPPIIPEPFNKPAPPLLGPSLSVLPNTEPYVLCDNEFKVVNCNDAFCELCQLKREELVGQELIKLIVPDSIPLFVEDLKRLDKHNSIENRDCQISLASGLESIPVRVTAVKDEDGAGYIFMFRNMAFQRQIMNILEERSAQLNALLEAVNGVVFSVGFENGTFGRIEQANKFLSALLDYEHDELISLAFIDIFLPQQPKAKEKIKAEKILKKASKELKEHAKTSFSAPAYTKAGERFDANVTITPLDIPNKNLVLVVVEDLSGKMDQFSQNSKEALELKSVRESLPGIYLKTDHEGRVKEVYSNLDYLPNARAAELFLEKSPSEYWPDDAAAKELFAIKETLSMNISTSFEFEQDFMGERRYYDTSVTPIAGRQEVIIWVKDITEKHIQEAHIRELYALSNANNMTITEQVDSILEFGNKVFDTDIGLVTRFTGSREDRVLVIYSTPNEMGIERFSEFELGECMFDVRDDNVVVFNDLGLAECKQCMHKEKDFGSLIAAPLYVGGKVAGALCFASTKKRPAFIEGAEELIGIMSRILSLRIELREAGKTINETAQSLTRTLEYVDLPAVMLDLKYEIKFANEVFLEATDRRMAGVRRREFFSEFIRNDKASRELFSTAEENSSGAAFQIKLDLLYAGGKYVETEWDVFIMKDVQGRPEGYALIGIKKGK